MITSISEHKCTITNLNWGMTCAFTVKNKILGFHQSQLAAPWWTNTWVIFYVSGPTNSVQVRNSHNTKLLKMSTVWVLDYISQPLLFCHPAPKGHSTHFYLPEASQRGSVGWWGQPGYLLLLSGRFTLIKDDCMAGVPSKQEGSQHTLDLCC